VTTLSKSLAALGVAKQSAFGTPAANPTFLMGVRGGSPATVNIDQSPEDRTSMDYRGVSEMNRNSVVHGVEASLRAHPGSIGLLLYAALGAIATTGAGPYTHTITPGTSLPYMTFWGLLGGSGAGNIFRVQDCLIDKLEITWDEAKRLEVALTAIGVLPGFPASVTAGTDEQRAASFQAGGGLFKVAMASSTPVTAPVKAGGFAIQNNLTPVQLSTSIVPGDVAIGGQRMETRFTTVPTDLSPWREITTGSTGGTTIAEQPVYGSYETKFIVDANTDLDILATKAAFACALPEADPAGGAAELELVGEPVRPASGAAFTAVLRNTVTAY
jgi:hypothetical protein